VVSGDIHLLAVDGITLFLNHISLPNNLYFLSYNILLVYNNCNITLVFIVAFKKKRNENINSFARIPKLYN